MKAKGTNPREEFRIKNLKAWEEVMKDIFPEKIPKSKNWKSRSDIVSVLNKLGSKNNLSHLFFPTGGGMDLTGSRLSIEESCIELHFDQIVVIINPKELTFHSFGGELEWAYFRIETYPLKPSGVYDSLSGSREELIELSPGNYDDRGIFDRGFISMDETDREIPIPKSARLVVRYFEGSFVIFAKGSIYNRTSATYDGRHNKMSAEQFHEHIEAAVNRLKTA